MTIEDAIKLCDVFVTADGGCPSCVSGMCEEANLAFPEFKFEQKESYGYVTVTYQGVTYLGTKKTYDD